MTPSPGIEPGPHWWEASALTTAPSLLPHKTDLNLEVLVFVEGGYRRTPSSSEDENQQQTQPTLILASIPGIKPGPHLWEASVLPIAPSLLFPPPPPPNVGGECSPNCAIPSLPPPPLLTKQLICINFQSGQQCISSLLGPSYLHVRHHMSGKHRKGLDEGGKRNNAPSLQILAFKIIKDRISENEHTPYSKMAAILTFFYLHSY